jgi:hypothetical protein
MANDGERRAGGGSGTGIEHSPVWRKRFPPNPQTETFEVVGRVRVAGL